MEEKMRYVRFLLAVALVFGLAAGLWGSHTTALAQDNTSQTSGQTYLVMAGALGPANMEMLAFAPQYLQVHRGDRVVWAMNGFHNVHVSENQIELIITPTVNGQVIPQINPEIAFPTVENGGTFSGDPVNSGIPLGPDASPTFSLVIDAPVGTYGYRCDVHPGMVGVIEVVDDSTAIPSPIEVAMAGLQEVGQNIGAGMQSEMQMAGMSMSPTGGQDMTVEAGGGAAPVTLQAFYPQVISIHAGDTVTWTVNANVGEPHTVTLFPLPGEDEQFTVIPPSGSDTHPTIALGQVFGPETPSGSEVHLGDHFNSGILPPGSTYTLKFDDPGIYQYGCFLHASLGMVGYVVVMPAAL
jgi:plastocyanin